MKVSRPLLSVRLSLPAASTSLKGAAAVFVIQYRQFAAAASEHLSFVAS
jgi:hypothetical protein